MAELDQDVVATVVWILVASAWKDAGERARSVPWHVRETNIGVAASLMRYIRATVGDTGTLRLNKRAIAAAWYAERTRLANGSECKDADILGMVTLEKFQRIVRELVDFAARQHLLHDQNNGQYAPKRRLTIAQCMPVDNGAEDLSLVATDAHGGPIGLVHVFTASSRSG